MNKILRYSFVALMAMLFGNVMADDVFTADFSYATGEGFTGGGDGTYTGSVASKKIQSSNATEDAYKDAYAKFLEKWTNVSSSLSNAYWANLSVKLGTASSSGKMTSIALGEKMTSNVKVTINVAGWGSGTNTMTLEATQGTISGDATVTVTNSEFKDFTFNISGGDATTALIISGKRLFVKSVKVETVGGGSTKKATTIEFSGDYVIRATCGKDESVNLPTATVKSEGAAVAGATVTWESNKTDIATIDGNKVKIANGTQGEVTIKASYAGDATYESSTKTYKLTVYKGAGLLKELVKEVTNGNEKWDNGGEFTSYWLLDIDNGMTSVPNIVTFAQGSYIYLTDGEKNLLFYGTNSKGLKKGDKISGADLGGGNPGAIWGTLKRYNKLPEFVFTDMEVKVESEGNAVEPTTITVDQLADNINAYLKIKDAEYVSTSSGNFNFKVGDKDLVVRNTFGLDIAFEVGTKYNLLGMGSVYKTTYQLYLTGIDNSTNINTIKTDADANAPAYNLAGQKVDKNYKGVVIMNGKKVMQK